MTLEGVCRTSGLLPWGIAEGVLIMKTSLLSLFAGTVFLAGSAIASAGEPMALTSTELDAVTAGSHLSKQLREKRCLGLSERIGNSVVVLWGCDG